MNRPRILLLLGLLLAGGLLGGWLLIGKHESRPRSAASAATPPPAPVAAAPVAAPTAAPIPRPRATAAAVARLIPVVGPAPAHPGAHHVPTKAEEPLPGAPPSVPIPPDFLEKMVDLSGKVATFALPGGVTATGTVELAQRDDAGNLSLVQGKLSAPASGFFFFGKEAVPGVAGAFSGNVRFDNNQIAYRAEPIGSDGASMLVPRRLDQVMCVGMPAVDGSKQNAPQTYPTNIPIPLYNNNVIPLQSLPGAKAVVYLDFNGGPGPWIGWGNFVALPSGANNTQIKDVWQRVAEDYQGFNINITTDVKVFNNAATNSRQHVMLTPTTTAAPGAGGVAYENSFNTSLDEVNWAFYTTGKNAAEVCAHEVGHTVGLSHEGQNLADGTHVEYYSGQGSGDVGWAPIMGAGYYDNLTQFSKGDYAFPSNPEDQLAIIANNNNNVAYRVDDDGATFATANYLEILADNTVSNEGIIETTGDVDAYRFTMTASGTATFTVNPVSASPDLDILASIYKSDDTNLVVSANPDTTLPATVTSTLAAGDYTLRVTSTGRGDPTTTGYSNYGVLGAYLITGSVANGVKPARFSLAENSANATAVGSVTPRNNHGSNAVTYSISGGNTGTPFAINSATGALTVATSAKLNYETYSTRWDVPAAVPLFVTITDATNPALTETIRVVVTLTNVNEAPTITGSSSTTMFAHTQVGTTILTVPGSDPDQFDFPTFSIVAGNTGNAFAIDPGTGIITPAVDINVTTSTVYSLTVRATDQGTPALTADATVAITVLPLAAGYAPGSINRAYYENISGGNISDLTGNANFPLNPDSEQSLPSAEGRIHGDTYGSVMRGYVIPPRTGSYTFWIAADDGGQLLISSDANPANAVQRAYNTSASGEDTYNNYSSQQSAALTLTAGQPYYIEARQKENTGNDHLSIAWSGPGFTQQLIPGRFLVPYSMNYTPSIPSTTFYVRRTAYIGSVVGTASVTDVNTQDAHGAFTITGGTGANYFSVDPATGIIRVNADPSSFNVGTTYTLTVNTTDNGSPALTGSGTISVKCLGFASYAFSNPLLQQIFTNIAGSTTTPLTSDPRYPYSPTVTRTLSSYSAPASYGTNYGDHIRALFTPGTTGSYTFYVSSDDNSRLFFNATGGTAAGAVSIAFVNGFTTAGNYTAQSSQTSAAFNLTAGTSYYMETVHKQGTGGDFLQVAYTGPSVTTPTIIPGSALSPYNLNVAPVPAAPSYTFALRPNPANGTVVGAVAATDPEGDYTTYAILSGNASGAFSIDPATGIISVANNATLTPNQSLTLTIGAQDSGIAGNFPQAAATVPVMINIPTALNQWRQDNFGANANNSAVSGNLADPDHDGLSNLLEYALGTNPLAANSSAVAMDKETIGANTYLRLTVAKNPVATDVTYSAEATGTLAAPGSWDSAGVVVETNTSGAFVARDSVPLGTPGSRFLRLKVTVP